MQHNGGERQLERGAHTEALADAMADVLTARRVEDSGS